MVVVDDGSFSGVVVQHGPRGVAQGDREALLRLLLAVIQGRHENDPGCFACREGQPARYRGVVGARHRRVVGRGKGHRDSLFGSWVQSHLEPGRFPFHDPGISNGQLGHGGAAVVVGDCPFPGVVVQHGPRGVAQGDREAFVRLLLAVVQGRHKDGLHRLPRREGQRPRCRGVVVGRRGRVVGCRIGYPHRLRDGRRQPHLEAGRFPFLDQSVSDGKRREFIVGDRPHRGVVFQSGPQRVAQNHREAFPRLRNSVVQSRNRDRPGGFSHREGQCARVRRVVGTRLGGAVHRLEVHRHRLAGLRIQAHHEFGRATLFDRGIVDGQVDGNAIFVTFARTEPVTTAEPSSIAAAITAAVTAANITVVVDDGPLPGVVVQRGAAGGVAQGHHEAFLGFLLGVVDGRHRDGHHRLSRREGQRPHRRGVVAGLRGRVVRRGMSHRHRLVGGREQSHLELGGAPLLHGRVSDGQFRRGGTAVVIGDGPFSHGLVQPGPRGVAQGHPEALVRLLVTIVYGRHRDGHHRLSRRKGQHPRCGGVVAGLHGRVVRGGIGHRHRPVAGRSQPHLEPGRAPFHDGGAGVSHGELRQVVIRNDPLRGAISQFGPHGIAQGHPEAFLRLVEVVFHGRDRDGPDDLSRRKGQRPRVRGVVVVRHRGAVRRGELHRHILVSRGAHPNLEPGRVPFHNRDIRDRQAGQEGIAVVVDDPDGHLGYPVQPRRTVAVLVPHLVGELYDLILLVGVLNRFDRDSSRPGCRIGVLRVVHIDVPADRRRPLDAVVSFRLVMVVGTLRSVGVHEAPPSVGGRLPGQPQVVAALLPFYDLQDLVRHRHRPVPRVDGGIVLGLDRRSRYACQQQQQWDGEGCRTPPAGE